ncbi:MAG: signal peptide peptidase SppA [Candidatus Aminicenantes bacterium]|nr:signal peptide peptidase SppA [Candidatus Aminicenantes bacterium]
MKKGVLIAILVLVLIIIFLALTVGYVYMQFTREPFIAENAVLKINLAGEIVDSDDSFFSKKNSIRDLWYHVKRAKHDERIKGMIVKISYLHTGFASVEDIGRILQDFRKSGKKVVAFIEGGGLREYFLATFADKVYAFKGVSLMLNGLAAEAVFLKKTFSKIGIEAEYYHIGKYKTAANMFTEEGLTPAHEEALQTLLDDIFAVIIEKIAVNRNINRETVRREISDFTFTCDNYVKLKLIDKLVYEDELLADFGKGYRVVDFDIYKETTSPLPYSGPDKVAVIFASGEIRSGYSGGQALLGGSILGSDTLTRQLRAVRKDPAVKAVVLRVNSPGGSPFASDAIRREAELLTKKKPLVISMSDVAASGGYQVSLSSSKILALPQTITGSIGVLGGKFIFKGFYDKIGLKKATIKTTKYADWFSDSRPFSKEERKKLMTLMTGIYDSFVSLVSKSRKMNIEDVEEVSRGRVWSGKSAVELRLVDQTGGLLDAIAEAKKLAEIPAGVRVGIRIYPKKKSLWDMVSQLIDAGGANPLLHIKTELSMYKNFFPALLLPYKIRIN